MAKPWHRNGNALDRAWWCTPEESRLILLALALIRRRINAYEPWLLGLQSHFIQRGLAISDQALAKLNTQLRRYGQGRQIVLVDNGQDSRDLHPSHVAEARQDYLDNLNGLPDAELTKRFDALAPALPANVDADFDLVQHRRPAFDRATLEHLIALAPDSGTAAWLQGFVR